MKKRHKIEPTATYHIQKSGFSRHYYYIMERHTDQHGNQAERIITRPLTETELNELRNKIGAAIPNIGRPNK